MSEVKLGSTALLCDWVDRYSLIQICTWKSELNIQSCVKISRLLIFFFTKFPSGRLCFPVFPDLCRHSTVVQLTDMDTRLWKLVPVGTLGICRWPEYNMCDKPDYCSVLWLPARCRFWVTAVLSSQQSIKVLNSHAKDLIKCCFSQTSSCHIFVKWLESVLLKSWVTSGVIQKLVDNACPELMIHLGAGLRSDE